MICLGISEDFFDAGVALCEDEKVLFAANEERYTRRKNEGGFPRLALQGLFDYTGINPADIDRIYVSGHMTPPFPVRLFPFLHNLMFDAQRSRDETLFKKFMDFVMFMTPVSHTSEDSLMRRMSRPFLPMATRMMLPPALRRVPIRHMEHHLSHAAGAFAMSGFDEALSITADGMGDGLSMTVSRCRAGHEIERLWKAESRSSFGLFFEVLTEAFGFIPCRDEGKITGLAAHGDPAAVKIADPFELSEGRLRYTGPYGRRGVEWAREELMKKYSREDISAWVQDLLEKHLAEVARWWLKETGLNRLTVAGGVFGNVKLNQRLHELDAVEQLFVYPNMGDGGLSLGAIRAGEKHSPEAVRDVFFGEDYTAAEIEAALKKRNLPVNREEDINTKAADLLAEGHIVARFTGRMEWGPRALGNRSILVRTSDRAVVDRLNTQLQRSDFMPFAPAMLAEDGDLYCEDTAPSRHTAEFMTVCFRCTEKMQREHPAVVHVDDTARAQLVRRETNPTFHRILERFREKSGTGVLLNTSFNIHEEPIVRTPDEGVAAFLNAKLDYLAIGEYLVRQPI